MNWTRWLVAIGSVGFAAAATTGCKDEDLRTYLGPNGRLAKWQDNVATAVCQLEVQNPNGLDQQKRICPNGEGGAGDKTTPPSYPPAQ
jgi:hypothetical protein